MLLPFLHAAKPHFRVSRAWLRRLQTNQELSSIELELCVGTKGYGNFRLPYLCFEGDASELRRLAFALLAATRKTTEEGLFLPLKAPGEHAQGVHISCYDTYYGEHPPRTFTYQQRLRVKQNPWYPQSLKWDPFRELPRFCLAPLPGEPEPNHGYWGINFDEPYAFAIDGYSAALFRLARLLLDYANAENPPEFGLYFEVEGGFRGVGPFSYEARISLPWVCSKDCGSSEAIG